MNIKRYMMDTSQRACGHCGPVEDPTGEYVLRADLIAAGCLVSVPDGEERKIEHGTTILHKGKLCYAETRWDDYFPFDVRERDTHKWVDKVGDDTIVQPVRLVRLEDVG